MLHFLKAKGTLKITKAKRVSEITFAVSLYCKYDLIIGADWLK
jgi:hypothetical protein